VAVPGNWTLQDVADQRGVADLPQYTNVVMPFRGPPTALPGRNPTGIYRRSMQIPARWTGRQIVIHVGGAESVHAVYVNGQFAGYGTDSRLGSEYDISDHVRSGANDIAVAVVRWSAHSYVEDQDQWWMAGLHRDVYVEARGTTHIASLQCDATVRWADRVAGGGTTVTNTSALDPTGTGILSLRAGVDGPDLPEPGWQIRAWIETLRGRRVGRTRTMGVPHRFAQPYVFTGRVANFDFEVPGIQVWSAEDPVRYRVMAELLDPAGNVC
jgi:beta-galactosidase